LGSWCINCGIKHFLLLPCNTVVSNVFARHQNPVFITTLIINAA
jgi:hypothetical protein